MILRRFTKEGVQRFREFLATCREKPTTAVPWNLLEDDSVTTVVVPSIDVDQRSFKSRRDAAEYFADLLAHLPSHEVAKDMGLWTWLSLCCFDELCPEHHGRREVKNDYYYIFEPGSVRHFYRHLLYLAWHVLQVAPTNNRLFLTAPVSTLDKVTSEVMKRLYLTRLPCIFEVLDRLYWDEDRGRARVGIVDSRKVTAGDLTHRFPIRMRQLEKTYDLFSVNADQLVEILGDEFRPNAPETAAATEQA